MATIKDNLDYQKYLDDPNELKKELLYTDGTWFIISEQNQRYRHIGRSYNAYVVNKLNSSNETLAVVPYNSSEQTRETVEARPRLMIESQNLEREIRNGDSRQRIETSLKILNEEMGLRLEFNPNKNIVFAREIIPFNNTALSQQERSEYIMSLFLLYNQEIEYMNNLLYNYETYITNYERTQLEQNTNQRNQLTFDEEMDLYVVRQEDIQSSLNELLNKIKTTHDNIRQEFIYIHSALADENTRNQNRIVTFENRNLQLSEDLENTRDRLAKAEANLMRLQNEREEEQRSLLVRIESLKESTIEHNNRMGQYQQELEQSLITISNLNTTNRDLVEKLNFANSTIIQLQENIEQLNNTNSNIISNSGQTCQSLENENKNLKLQVANDAQRIDELQKRVKELSADLVESYKLNQEVNTNLQRRNLNQLLNNTPDEEEIQSLGTIFKQIEASSGIDKLKSFPPGKYIPAKPYELKMWLYNTVAYPTQNITDFERSLRLYGNNMLRYALRCRRFDGERSKNSIELYSRETVNALRLYKDQFHKLLEQ